MEFLFKPAILLMNRLKFLKKFGLIFIISLLPMSLILINLVIQINNKIEVNNNQMIGLNYNSAIRSLVQHAQQHRGLSSTYLSGNISVKDQILAKQGEIQKDIESVDSLDNKYGTLLKTSSKWNDIKNQYIELEKNIFNLSVNDAISKQTQLIGKMLDLNSDVADTSYLILEQESYKYYLADNIVYKLPRTTEYMGQARALGSSVAAKKSATKDERFRLLYLSQTMSIALGDSQRGMNIIYDNYPEGKKILDETYVKASNSSKKLVDTINAELINSEEINIKSEDYYKSATNSIDDVYSLLNSVSNTYAEINQKDGKNLSFQRNILASVAIIATILIAYLFIGFYLAVKGTITVIQKSSSIVAEGDLSKYIEHDVKDETKLIIDSLNKIIEAFSNIIHNTKKVSNDVVSASTSLNEITEQTTEAINQTADAIQDIAAGADVQLKDTKDAAITIDEMASRIQGIAKSSLEVSKSSNEMELAAENGSSMINGAITKMNSINSHVEESSSIINNLGERSQSIGEIINTITEIASQTNLLALNAAIEAARAGEQGKGFAVVADEVRKLAEISSLSANQISELIKSMQEDTSKSVNQMNKVMVEVRDGVNAVEEAGRAFEKILDSTKGVVNQIKEISVVSKEIAESSEEATASLLKVSNVADKVSTNTQSVAAASEEQLASMEEVVSATEDLNSKAKELQEMIDKFKV
ncbi:methyl-accepting chemotaxis protein [Clostridium sp. C2-6-12]|uniref:methyl-accepting chemotaxis protein n=1 Tax=Clostridium sp. C2-6-12 TaxID=2698832 RepID=UPI00136E80ED|nr:methyl-accepting chemotaxis protein [Clostridium sp. C2-6-12]